LIDEEDKSMSNINDFVIENGVLKKYQGQGGDVVIPEGVTSIGDSAFTGCSSLTSVVIPEGVTSIGDCAFWGCRSLTSVVIPEGVTSIGDWAFKYCSSLASVVIPEGVTSIGKDAFSDCSSLTSIVIPEGVTSIGNWAFNGCSSLTSVVIPEGVTSIGDSAFRGCSSLTSVVIPKGVTGIGDSAFFNCSSLASVVIPEGVTYIGREAFRGCSSLASVVIPEGVTSIGASAFSGCSSLTSVVIPDGVTSIGDWAFNGCSSLTSVVIPEGVTSINDGAFYDCASLTSVVIPDSVRSIGDSAFSGCKGLADANGFVIVQNALHGYYGKGGDVVIPESVTSIGDSAFFNCSSLASVVIPEGVTYIGREAFRGCSSLASIVIPESVKSIGDLAFWGCRSLTSVVIPEGVTSIGDSAFNACSSLTSVVIPEGVTSIGDSAFAGCSSLTSVVIPEGVTSIGIWAFQDCSSLTSVVIPRSVTGIGKDAFGKCPSLNAIVAPSVPLQCFTDQKLGAQAACGFLSARERYTDQKECGKYKTYCGSQRKKILPLIFRDDNAEALRFYIDEKKVTLKNLDGDYLIPARQAGAEKCVSALLKWKEDQASAKPAAKKKGSAKTEQPSTAAEPASPLEAEYAEKYKAIYGDSLLKWMKLSGVTLPEVLLEDGTKVPAVLLKYIIVSYGGINPEAPKFMPEADAAAKLLRYDSFCEALAKLSGDLDCAAYPTLIPLLCRYGNAKQIKAMISAHKNWNTKTEFGGKKIAVKDAFTKLLMLSDTREAAIFFEKNGWLDSYAGLRGTTADEVKESFLFDFGFDENGVRRFELGNTVLDVRLQKDLKLDMFDTNKQKAVKSVPKTGADPALYQLAKDEIADMRSNIKKAYTIRKWELFDCYIEKTVFSPEKWSESYLKNAFLHVLAELLVWQQEGKTFTCSDGGLVTADGAEYALSDKPIILAHPMEMDKADIAAWQRYYTARGLKQPFEQVWEPVREASQIKPDRYAGIPIPVVYLRHAERRGISCDWYYVNDYSNSRYLDINGFKVSAEETAEQDKLQIASIKPNAWNRRTNMVISYLDRLTVYGRVRNDDVTVMDLMDGFTLAQITEFIKTAQEANAGNVTAALLEYKNNTYPDFDPMAEFTLEW
jgi:hypothetical protein